MTVKFYHTAFNLNEWFILLTGTVVFLLVYLMPKQFTRVQTLTMLLIGFYLGCTFDETFGIGPFNYYDINNTSFMELWDVLTYVMFSPFAYFFVYGYSNVKKSRTAYFFYISVWALGAILLEALAWHAGVYHYLNGYRQYYSLPFYLLALTVTMIYYRLFIKESG